MTGTKEAWSAERRKAASERMKAHPVPWTPERRKATSERMKKQQQNPIFHEKSRLAARESRKRQGLDPAFLNAVRVAGSKTMIRLNSDPNFAERNRLRRIEANKILNTPEFRKSASVRMRILNSTAEFWMRAKSEKWRTAVTKALRVRNADPAFQKKVAKALRNSPNGPERIWLALMISDPVTRNVRFQEVIPEIKGSRDGVLKKVVMELDGAGGHGIFRGSKRATRDQYVTQTLRAAGYVVTRDEDPYILYLKARNACLAANCDNHAEVLAQGGKAGNETEPKQDQEN